MCASQDHSPSSARSLFAGFLARLEAGEEIDFEVLCRAHPTLEDDLRRLKAAHEALYAKLLSARPRTEEVPRESFLERLREAFGPDADPGISIQGEGSDSGFAREILEPLTRRPGAFDRYRVDQEVGHGGMGTVLRVWDQDLRRWLAMKRIRARRGEGQAQADEVGPRTLGRFLEEAQVTGQLDHPGIVPVHELGLDAEGRVYFTMKLVEGRTLQVVFEELSRGAGGWTQARVLGLLLKACEAMAYAHDKRVIHRDLKPANIMVGRFGEVYVMDWGLARVLDREDPEDVRLQPAEPPGPRSSDPSSESPPQTLDGDVLGTPAYMPPEQARGEVKRLDERTDVYALGAMLYQLLTDRVPYVRAGERPGWQALLVRVLEGPPEPVSELAPRTPVELVAICEKAMARDPQARYANMAALADDLGAFVEGRVVSAHQTGTWAETRKWVQRNKPLAASLAATVLAIAAGGSAFAVKADQAMRSEHRAVEATEQVLRLSDGKVLEELVAEADALWPPHPHQIGPMESWLLRARGLLGRLPLHRQTLMEMRRDAESPPATAVPEDGERSWRFDAPEDQWQHDVLAELIVGLEAFEEGLLAERAVTPQHGWSVPRRLDFARELEAGFAGAGEYGIAWATAMPKISDAYPGMDPTPQMGLAPLGPDPRSGLWEFAHLMTGTPPERGDDGELILTEETGVVLVLLPGGTFWMGSQATDPNGRSYFPQAQGDESPVHEVELSPFFLSKYELTQAQWLRLTGLNPSGYKNSIQAPTLLHPVEQVTWLDCRTWLQRAGLALPSEAQWEYGARAGTDTPWWTGVDRESLQEAHAANLADQSAARAGATWGGIAAWPELDDGYPVHAPVGTYSPNRFGLHEVAGNLFEWCLDGYDESFYSRSPELDPVASWEGADGRVYRGGGFSDLAVYARSAYRDYSPPTMANGTLGVRPARALDR